MEQHEQGLYSQNFEHDSCGIGFTAHLKGQKTHKIIEDAITMLENMEHRGATGFEANTGDGAGILIQNPHDFFAEVCKKQGFELPEFGAYGVGMIFFPSSYTAREACKKILSTYFDKFGFSLLGYRTVPTNNQGIGSVALSVEPVIEQVFIKPKDIYLDLDALERRLLVFRRYTNIKVKEEITDSADSFYIASFSYKTIVYKGQLTSTQLRGYFPDLEDKRLKSALALIHSRFSTNTFPKWKLAQPFRFIAHNGEINTIRGNINWMKSYETLFRSSLFTKEEIELILPLLDENQSDSANLDKVVELLVLGGRSLAHVMMMLIPEAWEGNNIMEDPKKAFYEFHASLTEPWDGPASLCVTDGNVVGATLDRNGLRPSRFCVTDDDIVVMSSEAGALPVEPSKIKMNGKVEAGKIFIVDMKQGRIISDKELKEDISKKKAYRKWITENAVHIKDLPYKNGIIPVIEGENLLRQQQLHGYTQEDLKVLLAPMCKNGKEPIGSMGADIPLAVLSNHSQHLANYFKQLFAQVSNPPMDPLREGMVMSLYSSVGKTRDILAERSEHCQQIQFKTPILSNEELAKIKHVVHPNYKTRTISALFPAGNKAGALETAIEKLCKDAEDAIRFGCYNILLISDRGADKNKVPIPSLLAVGAIHHHLTNIGLRARAGIIIESGDLREVHHFAAVIGYGANAANPYLAFDSIKTLKSSGLLPDDITEKQAATNYIKAISAGLLKVFSKMGISTLQSYHGAQIFEILGLSKQVIGKCFKGTASRIEGLTFNGIAREVEVRHKLAFPEKQNTYKQLEVGGVYSWKQKGEYHLFNPETLKMLQKSVRNGDFQLYKQYAALINNQNENIFTLRGLLKFRKRRRILIEEVEPVEKIMKRFTTGAMSFGSISYEAHTTLAIAMNRIGAKSNSGEGGEDDRRYTKLENGDSMRSAIKQVASGRFGVSSYYLANADEIQIKMAQGAKPGEGGQLPGHKVNDWIGKTRNSTPGVGLISPPPHHDIYSIEDLAQLIFDLKNANREADISVKLVSEAGVGTIAAGVAKARADKILISGGDGGTGAAPLSSIRHTGMPWELGLAEAHQTLVKNNLRSRVALQTDGQIRTGRDLAIAALLGAEEWSLATAALIAEGCVMMRKCHNNTCPVGVATQNPELRKKFKGKPEHVINLFRFMAEELREIMAELGFRAVNEMIGQPDMLEVRTDVNKWKIKTLDLNAILHKEPVENNVGLYKQIKQNHELDNVVDHQLIKLAKPALDKAQKVEGTFEIKNINRAVGTMLSNEISKKYKGEGLPNDTISLKFKGSAGQSFGAFAAGGLTLELSGEANDYVGKGLSGAKIVVYPDKSAKFEPHNNVIIGNVAFYGAISGEAYIRGVAGQRFCVRNSGAKVVVEGVGDHGCEYMTGGAVVVLGKTGRNFAAGMSGGIAYVYDSENYFDQNCNKELVLLEKVENEEDVSVLSYLIGRHKNFTGSRIAATITNNLTEELKNFVKVIPKDYKAIIERNVVSSKKKVEKLTV